ncbi:MAG: DICT sensory domain-containing protein [Halobacteriota archaeon]
MGLEEFVSDRGGPETTLLVVNRTSPRPMQRLLEGTFENQSVDVDEEQIPESESDLVLLIRDGAVEASSTFDELAEAILLVNSDLYITGARAVDEVSLPAALDGLTEVPFRLRGYPESNKEKLLLITISRYIERLALEAGGGTLRSAFQKLSRINDERGTRIVYERLAAAEVAVHVYGVPNWTPPPAFDVVTHVGDCPEYRRSWFVVFDPPDGSAGHAALVAVEVGENLWEGFWTYRPSLVDDIDAYIEANF